MTSEIPEKLKEWLIPFSSHLHPIPSSVILIELKCWGGERKGVPFGFHGRLNANRCLKFAARSTRLRSETCLLSGDAYFKLLLFFFFADRTLFFFPPHFFFFPAGRHNHWTILPNITNIYRWAALQLEAVTCSIYLKSPSQQSRAGRSGHNSQCFGSEANSSWTWFSQLKWNWCRCALH